ncbi:MULTISPECIES: hypothetical protein [unclassified Pseudoalteromonas]|uniref:hypothetical protein n=1 Tax=unclassified Pseudoalteromonas TaxID=194690 RepID=UPI000F780AAF|nr:MULTISPECIES: hypothetical protein [unclassified Pseudoalteromonas]
MEKQFTGSFYVVNSKGFYKLLALLLIAISLIVKLYLVDFNVLRAFYNSNYFDIEVEYTPIRLVLATISTYLPLLILIIFNKKNKVIFYFSILVIIFNSFPTSTPRFVVASLYIPILIILFPKLIKGTKFCYLMLLSLLLIFPFLENFRNYSDGDKLTFIPTRTFFLNGHFDSYQSLLRVVSENIITYGEQLIGNLLFFIPREVWPDKSIGSGHFMAQKLGYSFENISMNFFGEAYINFGVLGLIIYGGGAAFVLTKIEINRKNNPIFHFIKIIMIGFIIMFLRGDFLVVYSKLFTIIVMFYFVSKIFILKSKNR